MSDVTKILIIDDDINVRDSLVPYMKSAFYETYYANNGMSGIEMFKEIQPDLIILDIMMPVLDGIETCRKLREVSNVPIIMLTAKAEEVDKLLALELGADDYVTKPFSPREILARIKAILRRKVNEIGESDEIHLGNMCIYVGDYKITIGGKVFDSSVKEFELLLLMAKSPSKVFTREKLLELVWGYEYFGDTRAVDSHIKRLRKKLATYEPDFELKTIWGVGYALEYEKE